MCRKEVVIMGTPNVSWYPKGVTWLAGLGFLVGRFVTI